MCEVADDQVRIATLGDVAARVGECPVWCPEASVLEWIDMPRGVAYRTDLTGRTLAMDLGRPIGALVPRRSGGWVAATWTGFAILDTEGAVTHEDAFLGPGLRMNDAACDPQGRLFAGSTALDFEAGAGAIHLLRSNGTHEVVLSGLTLPNGMGWSPSGDIFYLADSIKRHLLAFDVDAVTGLPSRRRLLRVFDAEDGLPDGLCVDADGCLWVALWDGGAIVRISPEGEELYRLRLPVARPTSCAFGGASGEILFVTTAMTEGDTSNGANGRLLVVHELGTRGRPDPHFDD